MSDRVSSGETSIPVESTCATRGFSTFPNAEVEQSIPARFEQQVRLYPERIAVADAESALTYRELNGLANRIARAILNMRGPGQEPVALLVGNGVPVVAAMLGVLKAGKFYVPLDRSHPQARTAAILEECRPGLLICDSRGMERAENLCSAAGPSSVPLLNLDDLDTCLSEENLSVPISPCDIAYLLYTSGSTGRPKGVIQDHRYVLHLTMVYTNSGQISSADRLALLYSPSFAGAVRDIYCALLNGAALLSFDVKREGLIALAEWLRRQQITVFFAVATMFRHFCRLLVWEEEDRFPSLRLIELGSETVYAGEVHLFRRHFSESCQLIVNYGGSEISPISQFPVHADTQIEGPIVPAGYPAGDVELFLWDSEGEPVGAGAVGEIVVRSRYLCRGYWGRPDLTQAAFLADPEGGDRRLFRTGDMGRLLSDGCLQHVGRRDSQVKIRGYRVETSEVEAFFLNIGSLRDAVVTVFHDPGGEPNLGAWLVPSCAETPPSVRELRALAAAALPDYMVPASIVLLDAMPLTPSGKVDRQALSDLQPTAQSSSTSHVAPRTGVEERLAEIWSELLGKTPIGAEENFFDLGGHSLVALQVVARVAAVFHVTLPSSCLFECPTIAQLAGAIERARNLEPDELIGTVPREMEIPISLAQERMWVLAGMESSDAFTLVRVFYLQGRLNMLALEQALSAIAKRHENLRARFRMSGNRPVQAIASDSASVLSYVDLRHLPEDRAQAALDASLAAASGRNFDLAKGPLWRVQVVRLAGSRYVLHLAMHHLIGDDWSVQVLLRELSAIYSDCLAGKEGSLPQLLVQYADYAVWQRRWLAGERREKQLAYWRDHLHGARPVVRLPYDRPGQADKEFRGSIVRLCLDRALTTRLRQLSRESETTLFVTLLASYALLLSGYGNPNDVVIGTVFANRYPVETEALIGFFVNTLPLRVRWRDGATFREIQACVHRAAANGFAHADLPFDHIVEALQRERSVVHNPIFQTLFVLQNTPRQDLALPGLSINPMEVERPSAGAIFDLTLSLHEADGELRGGMEFNTALFDSATVERMAADLTALLAGIVLAPDVPAQLPTVTARGSSERLEHAS